MSFCIICVKKLINRFEILDQTGSSAQEYLIPPTSRTNQADKWREKSGSSQLSAGKTSITKKSSSRNNWKLLIHFDLPFTVGGSNSPVSVSNVSPCQNQIPSSQPSSLTQSAVGNPYATYSTVNKKPAPPQQTAPESTPVAQKISSSMGTHV